MSARDELARDIFIADNHRDPNAAQEWDAFSDIGGVCGGDYAQNIAAGLITKGYRKLNPADEAAIDKVAATLAKADGWLSLAHPSPRHQTLLRERARAILTSLAKPEAEATR